MAMDLLAETMLIPVAGGRVLSARLWRPAADGCWPAIIDASPYRAGDIFRPPVEAQLPYFAACGYAALAIDIAGSGNSAGALLDEYEPREIEDLVAAVAFVAEQGWSDGSVGLSGFSWAAFAALRASAKKPPALKAMVLGGVSEDGWRTDIHYLGGALYTAQIDWAGVMLMFNSLPPDPDQFKGDWRAEWKKRLEAITPFIVRWLSHPTHDEYWKDRAADLTQSDVPLLLYAGLSDKYATSVLRIAERWQGPVRTIIGPWEHSPPYAASRGPRIGFLQEALRWWDKFLKGVETDALDEPPLRLWMGEPDGGGALTDGEWIASAWPSKSRAALRFGVQGDTLASDGLPADAPKILHPARSNPSALSQDLYEDAPASFDLNRARQLGALVAVGAPFGEDVALAPSAQLRCRTDARSGMLVARLLDIAPDGNAIRMTTGAIVLAGHSQVSIPFQAAAWRLKKGHSLAVAVSADGWPTFWPSPNQGPLAISALELIVPIIRPSDKRPTFAAPESAIAPRPGKLRWIDPEREQLTPPETDAVCLAGSSAAHHLAATGTDYFITSRFDLTPMPGGQARALKSYRIAFERPGWSIRICTRLEVSSTPDAFQITWTIEAQEGGQVVHSVSRRTGVPRTAI
jgi:uncharacterized protein